MPGDRFAFAIRIGCQINILFALGGFFQIVDDFFLALNDRKVGREIFFDIDAELALGQIDKWPTDALTWKSRPKYFSKVLALAGDSTMTRFFAAIIVNSQWELTTLTVWRYRSTAYRLCPVIACRYPCNSRSNRIPRHLRGSQSAALNNFIDLQ